MRAATLLSAAVLLTPGCGEKPADAPSRDEPLRRAGFRSLAAREFLSSCPGAAGRAETLYQAGRHDELKQLAAQSGADRPVAQGENEWAGFSRYSGRERCGEGDEAFRQALAAYGASLDALAARIAEYRP